MKTFNLGNGHTLTVNKKSENVYEISFFEDGRRLFTELADKEYIEWEYEITL